MALQNHAKDFLNIIRTVQLSELRDQLAQPPLLLVIGADTHRAQQFASALTDANAPDTAGQRVPTMIVTPNELGGLQVGPVPYDVVLLLDPSPAIQQHPLVRRFVGEQWRTPVLAVITGPGAAFDPGIPTIRVADALAPQTLRTLRARLIPMLHPDRRAAWGRAFPGFRQPITDFLIEQTARANAQFAIVADLTARIPMIGQYAAAGADFLILTKNQLILAYQLAAIHGRDLNDQKTALVSAAPFLIAGLGWRELAHRAVNLVPGAPFVPKAVIAYGGTIASGRLARLLADPEGVRAWLNGVQHETKISLGVGRAKMRGLQYRLGQMIPRRQPALGPGSGLEPPVHVIPAAD